MWKALTPLVMYLVRLQILLPPLPSRVVPLVLTTAESLTRAVAYSLSFFPLLSPLLANLVCLQMCSFSVELKEPEMFILGSFAFSFSFLPFLAAFRSIFPRGHIKGYYVSDQASMGRSFCNSRSLGGRILLLGLKQQLKCFNVQGI